ncbi:MAG: hydantoinase/oxoprolinase family protein [Planctomycetes bacterium]|nr:hydantoinase/oxoprolinase family protein [Planctomycetota bacterium]
MAAKAPIIAAIDVGGTFTDACVVRDGKLLTCKIPSTPGDPGVAVAAALERLGGADLLVHGTTVATNALLEGKLGRVVFVTTKGFRDVLAIGRQNRDPGELYSLEPSARNPLVPHELRVEVDERLEPDGSVARKLTSQECARVANEVKALKPDAVAVCLLHSYANPAHERALQRALTKLRVPVTLSSELAPEFREYERSLVTAANAGLIPRLRDYITKLQERIAPTRVVLMHSAGGWLPARLAADEPVKLALSGPAGGIAGVRDALTAEKIETGVAFDIGGTSTDVSLVEEIPTLRPETLIAGLPLRTPSLDIHTIGAGGGSIAWLDAGGALHVGPQSAGADPGPACYARGGKHATLTDALLVLGRIPPDLKLGGELALDPAAATGALKRLGRGTQPKKLAEAIVRVALAGIERALRRVTVERGRAVGGMALVPFGGAGGLLACDLAELMGIEKVLVPRAPGLLCALGMLHTPASRDLSRTVMLRESRTCLAEATRVATELQSRAERELRDCGLSGPFQHTRTLDVRYVGQSFELGVPLTRNWKTRFGAAHLQEFHFERKDAEAEIVNVRVRVEEKQRAVSLPIEMSAGRAVAVGKVAADIPVYERQSLSAGTWLNGPAVVTELSSCLYLKRGWVLKVTQAGQLMLLHTQNIG